MSLQSSVAREAPAPEPRQPEQAGAVAPWPFVDRRIGDRRGAAASAYGDPTLPRAATTSPPTQAAGRRPWRSLPWQRRYGHLVLLSDAVMVAAAAVAAYVLRFATLGYPQHKYLWGGLVLPLLWCLAMALIGGYGDRVLARPVEEAKEVFQAAGALTLAVATLSYASRQQVARGYVLAAVPFVTVFALLGRYLCRRVLLALRRRGRCLHRVLVAGHERGVNYLVRQVRTLGESTMQIVGACVPRGVSGLLARSDVAVLGDLRETLTVALAVGVDVVAVTPCTEVSEGALRRLAWSLEDSGIELMVAPGLVDVASPRLHIASLCGMPMLHVGRPLRGPRMVVKGVVDRAVAAALLLLLAPLVLCLAIAIPLNSRGPALFRQSRVGRHGSLFTMYKFRSMHLDAEARRAELADANVCADGLMFKVPQDPRVTSLGRWLRRTSIDELPQLVNVLLGQMSLVGPRPPLPNEANGYGRDLNRRLLLKPGITGLWQVSGRSDLSWDESMRLDLRYVENWSLGLDAHILYKTISAVLRGAGAY